LLSHANRIPECCSTTIQNTAPIKDIPMKAERPERADVDSTTAA